MTSGNEKIADKTINSLKLNIHDKCPRCHGEECSYCEGYGYIYNPLGLEIRHKIIEALDAKDAEISALRKLSEKNGIDAMRNQQKINLLDYENETLTKELNELKKEMQGDTLYNKWKQAETQLRGMRKALKSLFDHFNTNEIATEDDYPKFVRVMNIAKKALGQGARE